MCMSVNGGASRRSLLLGAGAVGAAGVLAACGGDDPTTPPQSPGPPGGGGTTPGGATTTPEGGATGIPTGEIPVGGGRIYLDQRVVVTQPQAGEFRAFDATCTHEFCTVTSVEAGVINCTCHGSQFRIEDGSVARGPATRSLPARTATVNDGTIVIS
jgi:Rieske Fe-S protein